MLVYARVVYTCRGIYRIFEKRPGVSGHTSYQKWGEARVLSASSRIQKVCVYVCVRVCVCVCVCVCVRVRVRGAVRLWPDTISGGGGGGGGGGFRPSTKVRGGKVLPNGKGE